MTQQPDAPWLPPLADLVAQRLGLHFPAERFGDLMRGVNAAASSSGARDTATFAQRLLIAPDAAPLQALAEALTVGETYFFRERESFDVLADRILPPLIESRRKGLRRLRFWSAGCCTGEEPYSLAILLGRMLPDLPQWDIRILATDVNRRFLQRAVRAEYDEWSFRDAPAWLKDRYFHPGKRGHVLLPHIRRMVSFAPLNLAELQFPQPHNDTAAMDVILCRNVLMYFPPALMQQVCRGFERALVEGGWLSVAATELGAHAAGSFAPVYFDDAVFYRKAGGIHAPGQDRPAADAAPAPMVPAQVLARAPAQAPAPPTTAAVAAPLPTAPAAPAAAQAEAAGTGPAANDTRRLAAAARAHADAGRLGPALEAVEQALAHDKMDAGTHHLHAVVLMEMRRAEDARNALRRALYLEPDFVIAHHALGQLALREGAPADAARHFRNVLSLLDGTDADAVLPHSDGLVAGRLGELVNAAVRGRAGR